MEQNLGFIFWIFIQKIYFSHNIWLSRGDGEQNMFYWRFTFKAERHGNISVNMTVSEKGKNWSLDNLPFFHGEDRFRTLFVLKISIEKNVGEYPENSGYLDNAETSMMEFISHWIGNYVYRLMSGNVKSIYSYYYMYIWNTIHHSPSLRYKWKFNKSL